MKPGEDPVILVHFTDGHVEPHDTREVVGRIARDLQPSGLVLQPWVIAIATECLVRHFQEASQERTIYLAEFIDTCRELLESFVEETGRSDALVRQFDLFTAAQRPGCGFELELFGCLRSFLAGIGKTAGPSLDSGAASPGFPRRAPVVQITGLDECVRFLTGQRHWSRRCDRLRDDIVEFIRRELERGGRDSPLVAIVP